MRYKIPGCGPARKLGETVRLGVLSRHEHIAWHSNCLVIPRGILGSPRTPVVTHDSSHGPIVRSDARAGLLGGLGGQRYRSRAQPRVAPGRK